MSFVKYLMIATALLAAVLGLAVDVLETSGAIKLLVVLAAPIVLGVLSIVEKRGLPRWAGGVSIVAFLLVGMRTTEPSLDNVMMAAFLGLILSIILTIRPDRPRVAHPAGA